MSVADRLRLVYWTHFSQPAQDRRLLRRIQAQRVVRILEIGVGTAERAWRMIEVARLASPTESVFYAGIDLFEDRSAVDGPGLSLKAAYCRLRRSGTRVQLIPGDPLAALAHTANGLGRFDLVVVSRWPSRDTMAGAWHYLPRMLHPGTEVFREREHLRGTFELFEEAEVRRLAAPPRARRAA